VPEKPAPSAYDERKAARVRTEKGAAAGALGASASGAAAASGTVAKPASPSSTEKQARGGARVDKVATSTMSAAAAAANRSEGAAFASAATLTPPTQVARQPPTPLPPVKWGNLNATLRMEAAAAASTGGGAVSSTTSAPMQVAVAKEAAAGPSAPSHAPDELPFDLEASRALCWFSFGCADESCAFLHIGLARCSNESADGSTPCLWHQRRACRFLHADQERFIERDRSTIVRLRKGFPLEIGCTTDAGVRVSVPAADVVVPTLLAPGGATDGGHVDALFPGGLGGPTLPNISGAGSAATIGAAPDSSLLLAGADDSTLAAVSALGPDDVGAALADYERASTAVFSALAAGGPAPFLDSTSLVDGAPSTLRFPVELGLRDYARHLVSLFSRGVEARFVAATGAAKAAKSSWLLSLQPDQCWDEQQLLRCCNVHRQAPSFLSDLAGRTTEDGLSLTERRALSDGLAFFHNVRTWLAQSELGVSAAAPRSPFVVSSVEALVAAAGAAIAVFAVLAAADFPVLRAEARGVLRALVYLRTQIRAHFASQSVRESSLAANQLRATFLPPALRHAAAPPGVMMAGFEFPRGLAAEASAGRHAPLGRGAATAGDASASVPAAPSQRPQIPALDGSSLAGLGAGALLSPIQLAEAPAQAFLRSNTEVYAWLRSRHAITRSGVMLCPPLALRDGEIPFQDSATLMALAEHGFLADT
jgi:hypothetical protein